MRTQTLTLCFRRYTDCTRPSTEWGARETRVSPEDRSGRSCVPSSYKYYAAPDRRQPSSPFSHAPTRGRAAIARAPGQAPPARRVEHHHRAGIDQPVHRQRHKTGRPAHLTVRLHEVESMLVRRHRCHRSDTHHGPAVDRPMTRSAAIIAHRRDRQAQTHRSEGMGFLVQSPLGHIDRIPWPAKTSVGWIPESVRGIDLCRSGPWGFKSGPDLGTITLRDSSKVTRLGISVDQLRSRRRYAGQSCLSCTPRSWLQAIGQTAQVLTSALVGQQFPRGRQHRGAVPRAAIC